MMMKKHMPVKSSMVLRQSLANHIDKNSWHYFYHLAIAILDYFQVCIPTGRKGNMLNHCAHPGELHTEVLLFIWQE